VVVWETDAYVGYGDLDIAGRRIGASGTLLSNEFFVNTYTTYAQRDPAVAVGPSGEFVVVWVSEYQVEESDIFGQRFDRVGNPVGGEFLVNTHTPQRQVDPDVGIDAAGNFVVVWAHSDCCRQGIFGRRFRADGTPDGPEFDIDDDSQATRSGPVVSIDAEGGFLVAWTRGMPIQQSVGGAFLAETMPSSVSFSGTDVFGRAYDAAGTPVGEQFLVNVETEGDQSGPAIASLSSDRILIAWLNPSAGVVGRLFDATGTPGTSELFIAPVGTHPAEIDAVATTDGQFVVSWTDDDVPGGSSRDGNVFARRLLSDGQLVGAQMQVHDAASYDQSKSSLGTLPDGGFVVAWEDYDFSYGHDGSRGGVFMHRFPGTVVLPNCPEEPRSFCFSPGAGLKSVLTIRNGTRDKRDRLSWKWSAQQPVALMDLGDPILVDDLFVCLYAADHRIFTGYVPSGPYCTECWRRRKRRTRYRAERPNFSGLTSLTLQAGERRATTLVRGRGDDLTLPELPIVGPLRAQLTSATGACHEVEFDASHVVRSSRRTLKAKR
jgi:hypothetical protein